MERINPSEAGAAPGASASTARVEAVGAGVDRPTMAGSGYRGFVPRPAMPDLKLFHGYMGTIPTVDRGDFADFERRLAEPYVGITTDGTLEPGLYDTTGERPSTAPVVAAAREYLASLSGDDQRLAAQEPLDSPHRRRWTNAFATWLPVGLLLDDLTAAQRNAAMGVVRAAMSEAGFEEARKTMILNEALGDLVGMYRDTLREWIYWFTIFGEPSDDAPWGWQLMGHHLVMNCFVDDGRMILSPVFMGAETIEMDEGRFAGLRAFDDQQRDGLALIRSLEPAQQDTAILYRSMRNADLPPELNGRVDGRHRGGAGRDNLVLGYNGIAASDLTDRQRALMLALIETYLGRTCGRHAGVDLARVRRHLDQTYFAWIGDPDGDGPFYYRVHSPVVLIEFDHHPGIFLDAEEPQPFHAHTIVRFPNAGDYGIALLKHPAATITAP